VTEGYLAQTETNERYYLGGSALLLGQTAYRNFRLDVLRPVLERLAARQRHLDQTGTTVRQRRLGRGQAPIDVAGQSAEPAGRDVDTDPGEVTLRPRPGGSVRVPARTSSSKTASPAV
jgi:hypothetical protein